MVEAVTLVLVASYRSILRIRNECVFVCPNPSWSSVHGLMIHASLSCPQLAFGFAFEFAFRTQCMYL